jgi:hypothetical protein
LLLTPEQAAEVALKVSSYVRAATRSNGVEE